MADPKVEIGIWAGIPLVVLIIFSVGLDNSKEINKNNRTLKGKAGDYKDYYLNDKATIPFEAALANNKNQLADQEDEYEQVVVRMMPELPLSYKTDNYTKASARATEDLEAIRKLAERNGVTLPADLPNEDALDVDPIKFSQQMAHLYLFRTALDMIIRDSSSGKLNVLTIAVNKETGKTDVSGEIALFMLDINLKIDFRSLERVMRTFNNNKKGVAIRMLDVEVPDKGKINTQIPQMKVNMTVSLLTPNNPDWALPQLGSSAGTQSDGGATRGVRGGRF